MGLPRRAGVLVVVGMVASALVQSAQAASLRAAGLAQASTETPNQELLDVTQAVGPIDQGTSAGSAATDTEGVVHAQLNYGLVSLSAFCEARLPTPPPIGGETVLGSGNVIGEWSDEFTIHPPSPALATTPATIVFSLLLHGIGTADGAGANQSGTFASYRLDASIGNCVSGCSFAQQGSWTDNGPAGGGLVFSGDPVTGLVGVSVPVQFSLPIPLHVKLIVSAQAIASSDSFATASGEFGHTLEWGGISEVRDAQQNLVTGYSVTSNSGVDWSKPVPEPGCGALNGVAVVSLAALRAATRRPRSAAISFAVSPA
jgi:hypothetical protein